jgi:predicted DNA-binding transcriptional regulator AlpA
MQPTQYIHTATVGHPDAGRNQTKTERTTPAKQVSSLSLSAHSCRLLNENQAAQVLQCSVALMRKMRRLGTGPTVTRIGRLCRYAESDLAAFIAANREEKAA